jgi:hypothetical protein
LSASIAAGIPQKGSSDGGWVISLRSSSVVFHYRQRKELEELPTASFADDPAAGTPRLPVSCKANALPPGLRFNSWCVGAHHSVRLAVRRVSARMSKITRATSSMSMIQPIIWSFSPSSTAATFGGVEVLFVEGFVGEHAGA